MDEMDIILNRKSYHITKYDVISAFNQTNPEDWQDLPGPDPYHVIVINSEEKPVKAVFRKIFNTNNFITSDGERVLKKLDFEFKIIGGDQVYLMPIGNEHAVEHMNMSLLNKIPKDVFDSNGVLLPGHVYDGGGTNCWGLEPGRDNIRKWGELGIGDHIIFLPSNYAVIVAEVTHKIRDSNLARTIWGSDLQTGQTWELMFFLRVIRIVDLDKRTLLTALGYGSGDNLMGSRRITDRFSQTYTSISKFLDKYSGGSITTEAFSQETADRIIDNSFSNRTSHEERLSRLENAIRDVSPTSGEYVMVNGKRIKRNQLFVKYVKERDNYKCKACDFTFNKRDGTPYVEAAHVIGLGNQGVDSPDNMVALCANCHKKLDKGNTEASNEVLNALRAKGLSFS